MNKLNDLLNWFEHKDNVIVSLSGGVDSCLVAYAAFKKLGTSALAITANYQTLSQEELVSAKQICSEIGIKQEIISYDELENENFIQNDQKRCFYCRSELAEKLNHYAKKHQFDYIVDGTNLDDLGDYRPGIEAMQNCGIRSPLVETKFTKEQVRLVAKTLGLSVHDKPSNSCLASRIPWGQRISKERLIRIEMSETWVKQIARAKQVRVRDFNGSAKIELNKDELNLVNDEKIFQKIKSRLLLLGFNSVTVDPEGYSPGKINVILD